MNFKNKQQTLNNRVVYIYIYIYVKKGQKLKKQQPQQYERE